jgi:hypothetical protein
LFLSVSVVDLRDELTVLLKKVVNCPVEHFLGLEHTHVNLLLVVLCRHVDRVSLLEFSILQILDFILLLQVNDFDLSHLPLDICLEHVDMSQCGLKFLLLILCHDSDSFLLLSHAGHESIESALILLEVS